MAATPTPPSFESLLGQLREAYPKLSFKKAATFYWSPKDNTVYYSPTKIDAEWSLVHELSHALLNHTSYNSDFELLLLEVAAWERAEEVATTYRVVIEKDHIQDCLDTYRDWLHRRSECPTCQMRGLQVNPTTYECTNCFGKWHVSMARFCRPYRRQIAAK